MCRIKAEISDGLIANELFAHIHTVDGGVEEVVVSKSDVAGSSVKAAQIHASPDKVLVELPRESMSGKFRIWVQPDRVER